MRGNWVIVTVLGCCVVARADERALQADYELGIARYHRGEYAAAIADFRRAYGREPRPGLLFNLAQAYRQLGDADTALALYRRFVDESAPSQARDDAERLIADLRARATPVVEAQREPPPPSTAAAPPQTAVSPAASRPEPRRTGSGPRRFGRLEAIALVGATAGIGTTLLAVGGGLTGHAHDVAASLETPPSGAAWSAQYQSRYDDGRASAQAGTAMLVLGASAVAASAVSAIVCRRLLAPGELSVARTALWTF
jgi:tetratricopeptide (TPR) repeat protein